MFYTDCETQGYEAANIYFKRMSFEEYIGFAKEKTGASFNPANAYKLCDLRPLYPIIHYDDIQAYDFYGWTDMDLLFGDIRSFYSEEILSKYDVFSTHKIRISGHMALFRNTRRNRNMYRKIYKWQEKLSHPQFVGIDEHGITNAYTMTIIDKANEKFKLKIDNFFTRFLKKRRIKKLYMVEQYTTPFSTIPWLDGSKYSEHPKNWIYKNGVITNDRDGNRTFIYLHFMNFKGSQWRHDGTKAPWEGKEMICYASPEDMKKGIKIGPEGIFPIA